MYFNSDAVDIFYPVYTLEEFDSVKPKNSAKTLCFPEGIGSVEYLNCIINQNVVTSIVYSLSKLVNEQILMIDKHFNEESYFYLLKIFEHLDTVSICDSALSITKNIRFEFTKSCQIRRLSFYY